MFNIEPTTLAALHTNPHQPNTIHPGAPHTIIEGQGHQMGDEGWEQSVMGPLRTFLDGLT